MAGDEIVVRAAVQHDRQLGPPRRFARDKVIIEWRDFTVLCH